MDGNGNSRSPLQSMQQWQSHKQKYKINKCAPLWLVDKNCQSTSLCLKDDTRWIEPPSCKRAKGGSATQIHNRGHSTTKQWHEMGWPWPPRHWERGPRAGPAGWHSAALEGRTPFVRQTPSRPLLLLLCTDLIYSALLCPILHSPPLPLLCRPCTTTTFFYCRLCLVSGLRCSLFLQLPLSRSIAIQLYHIDKKLTVFLETLMKTLSGSHYSLFSLSLLQHSHSVANPTISYLLVINCSLANLMELLSGILKNDFHGAEGTTKFYLLLGGALLHDFAAWYARECIGRQQHDMLVELVEEALQVQHSHIMLQGTVESHRSCRASSFCILKLRGS